MVTVILLPADSKSNVELGSVEFVIEGGVTVVSFAVAVEGEVVITFAATVEGEVAVSFAAMVGGGVVVSFAAARRQICEAKVGAL